MSHCIYIAASKPGELGLAQPAHPTASLPLLQTRAEAQRALPTGRGDGGGRGGRGGQQQRQHYGQRGSANAGAAAMAAANRQAAAQVGFGVAA